MRPPTAAPAVVYAPRDLPMPPALGRAPAPPPRARARQRALRRPQRHRAAPMGGRQVTARRSWSLRAGTPRYEGKPGGRERLGFRRCVGGPSSPPAAHGSPNSPLHGLRFTRGNVFRSAAFGIPRRPIGTPRVSRVPDHASSCLDRGSMAPGPTALTPTCSYVTHLPSPVTGRGFRHAVRIEEVLVYRLTHSMLTVRWPPLPVTGEGKWVTYEQYWVRAVGCWPTL